MSDGSHTRYDPHAIEARRQAAWRERDAFRTPPLAEEQPHLYIKPSAPFTSGNIHIGHVRSYSIGDAYARFRRARGDAVLFAFGFDAFGLPAELGAIAGGEPPSDWVNRCAEHMTGQLERLGFSFDWERSFLSSDPIMYRWSQWLFLTLLEAGLIYRGHRQRRLVRHLPDDARDDPGRGGGTCWRCHDPVRLIQRPQWYLRDQRLRRGERPAPRRARRRAATGTRSRWPASGSCSAASTASSSTCAAPDGAQLTVFTPHADALARGALRADLAASTPRSTRGRPTPTCASSSRRCARAAGSAARARPRRSR